MKKSLLIFGLFVAIGTLAFGQTTQNILTTSEDAKIEVYQKPPKQVTDDKAVDSAPAGTSAVAAPAAAPAAKSASKGCGDMETKHACCANMSKEACKDMKKGKKDSDDDR